MTSRILAPLLLVLLTACAPTTTPAPSGGDVIAPTAQVDLVFTPQVNTGAASATAPPAPSATTQPDVAQTPQVAATEASMELPTGEEIVLQYDVSGGFMMPTAPVPLITIYADGFVIYTRLGETEANPQVWSGQLNENEFTELFAFMAQSGLSDALKTSDFVTIDQFQADPNIRTTTTDAATAILRYWDDGILRTMSQYPAAAQAAGPYAEPFTLVRDYLLSLEPANAKPHEFTEFILWANEVDALENLDEANRALYQPWPFPDLALEYSTSPGQVVTPDQAREINQALLTAGIYYTNGDGAYTVALYAIPPRDTGLPNPIPVGPR